MGLGCGDALTRVSDTQAVLGWQLGPALPASYTEEVKYIELCMTNSAIDGGVGTLEGVARCSLFSWHLWQILQPTFRFLFLPALDGRVN